VNELKQIKVETSAGEFLIKKPGAGIYTDAIEAAQMIWGTNPITVVKILLPQCIKQHPFGTTHPLKDQIRSMEPEDYTKLAGALRQLIDSVEVEKDTKKSDGQSSTDTAPSKESVNSSKKPDSQTAD